MSIEIHPPRQDDGDGDATLDQVRKSADTLYAMYKAYLDAGFNPEQAWHLVLYALDLSTLKGAERAGYRALR